MKSFTAKEFSRCPAKVYEAARDSTYTEIKHDRFSGKFYLLFVSDHDVESMVNELECGLKEYIGRNTGEFSTTKKVMGAFGVSFSGLNKRLKDFESSVTQQNVSFAMRNTVDNGDGTISFRRPKPYDHVWRGEYEDVKSNLIDAGLTQDDIDCARRKLIDSGLIPPDQLTEEEREYLKNKKAPD